MRPELEFDFTLALLWFCDEVDQLVRSNEASKIDGFFS
jgi:hypothetical protein